jgi:hypothetical protein
VFGFSIELSLLVLSRSDRKSFKIFFRKLGRAIFLQAPTEEGKETAGPLSRGYGAADPQRRTPNVSADSFIGRWTLGVRRWTFSFCREKGVSTHPDLHVPITV